MTDTTVVEMKEVTRIFPGSPPVNAVRSVDLRVNERDYVSIAGPSGSGKSTLLNLIGCLDRPTRGTYMLKGVDVGTLTDGRRAGLRGKEIGFVFQIFHLLPHRTVTENVMTGMLYNRTSRADRRRLAVKAIGRVGLDHRADFLPTRLSGGEQQRVAIARAIAASPSVLLCDEPTGNLDSKTTESLLELFDELRVAGLTLVVVTHDPMVSQRADRRLEMVDGVMTGAA